MPSPPQSSVRVVVKLPYDRPENPPNDPPKIEWTQEKADILWKVIERSRSVDSAGADWKGLAAHLEVPLPYLLYRVNARFQEDIRGLRDIQGALSPTTPQPQKTYNLPEGDKPPTMVTHLLGNDRLSSSKSSTRLGVRARLSSLGNNSRPRKATSSSTLTVQATSTPLLPTSPTISGDSDSEDEDAIKEEEEERAAEQEELLNDRLAELQKMMTGEALGLVTGSRRDKDKGKSVDRGGRLAPLSPRSAGSSRIGTLSSRSESASASQSLSSGSQQGSIPEIPSSPADSQPQSPRAIGKNLSTKSFSPPVVSSRSAVGQVHRSDSHGSEASSYSDISDLSSIDSALLSNLGNYGSRFSQFTRSRVLNRTHSVVPQ